MELLAKLGIEWPILLAQVVNFAILLTILAKFVYKPVMRMLDERREGIAKALEREEKTAAKLASADTEKEKILTQARMESQALLDATKRDGEALKQRIIASAKEEIAKLKTEADRKLKDERTRLITEVKGEIGGLIVDTIEKTLGDILDARTQGKMVEQALAAIREGQKK
ncbi:MAG: ATP synthase F0 subunit B [Omnitrophica bacterium RIFCSPLOWO2_01_FULL_45_24]|nr:MAG: ATP synthase F0 subunit B [Omnitrophica bacterium RIFCSPLOWO2_01_FULL_45_24]